MQGQLWVWCSVWEPRWPALHWKSALTHLGMTTPAALFGLVIAVGYAYGVARAVPWKLVVAAVMAICSVRLPYFLQGAIRSMTGKHV